MCPTPKSLAKQNVDYVVDSLKAVDIPFAFLVVILCLVGLYLSIVKPRRP